MRILFIIDGLGRGGRERRFVQLVRGLNEAGYNELFLINTRNILDYTEILDYEIKYEFMDRKAFGFSFKFIKRVREIKPDIIQPWIDISAAWANIAYYFCKTKPIYISSFIADCNYFKHALWSKLVMKWAYSLSTYVVSNSIAGLKSYKVPKYKWKCIYNGFDFKRLDFFYDHDVRKELNINTKLIVSMVARFTYAKDYPMYIKTAIEFLKKRDDVTFLAVGDGPNMHYCKSLIPEEYKERLILTGIRNDVEAIYRCSDFTILCTNSSFHGEGVSNSIVESMAFGKPVIATEGGGTVEIIDNNVTGFIFREGDETQLYDMIENLLLDEKTRKEMGRSSVKRIRETFSLEISTTNYIDMYNKALKI